MEKRLNDEGDKIEGWASIQYSEQLASGLCCVDIAAREGKGVDGGASVGL
jgi:hypothetical protein